MNIIQLNVISIQFCYAKNKCALTMYREPTESGSE